MTKELEVAGKSVLDTVVDDVDVVATHVATGHGALATLIVRAVPALGAEIDATARVDVDASTNNDCYAERNDGDGKFATAQQSAPPDHTCVEEVLGDDKTVN